MNPDSNILYYLLSALLGGDGGGYRGEGRPTNAPAPQGGGGPAPSPGGNFVPFTDIYPGGVPPTSPPGSPFGGISPAHAAQIITGFQGGGALPPPPMFAGTAVPPPMAPMAPNPMMSHPNSQQPYIPNQVQNFGPMGGQQGMGAIFRR